MKVVTATIDRCLAVRSTGLGFAVRTAEGRLLRCLITYTAHDLEEIWDMCLCIHRMPLIYERVFILWLRYTDFRTEARYTGHLRVTSLYNWRRDWKVLSYGFSHASAIYLLDRWLVILSFIIESKVKTSTLHYWYFIEHSANKNLKPRPHAEAKS